MDAQNRRDVASFDNTVSDCHLKADAGSCQGFDRAAEKKQKQEEAQEFRLAMSDDRFEQKVKVSQNPLVPARPVGPAMPSKPGPLKRGLPSFMKLSKKDSLPELPSPSSPVGPGETKRARKDDASIEPSPEGNESPSSLLPPPSASPLGGCMSGYSSDEEDDEN